MAAKKGSSNYIVSSVASDISKTSPHYLGKLKPLYVQSEFIIYGKGRNPNTKTKIKSKNASSLSEKSSEGLREELGYIIYVWIR